MAFTKVLKTASYYRRFQVKPRRRREGKTDYQARRNMIRQDKRKLNSPKRRFVVRFTNRKCICQIVYATIQGDRVVATADSTELSRYGLPVGQTNYAAAYATGLLCARRCLKQVGLDELHTGVETADGEEYHIEQALDEEARRPFKCFMDIGLVHTTTGNRVFGALKGAVDGGLHIPHSVKRFPGSTRGEGAGGASYDAEVHRKRIFAVHVADYMKQLQEEDPDKFAAHFSRYVKAGVSADNLEEKVKAAHAAIRADPSRVTAPAKSIVKAVREGNYIKTVGKDGSAIKYFRPLKLSCAQRKERVQQKIMKVLELAAQEEGEAADETAAA